MSDQSPKEPSDSAVEKKARQLALEYLNACRVDQGRPLLSRLPTRYWVTYAHKWLDRARRVLKGQPVEYYEQAHKQGQ